MYVEAMRKILFEALADVNESMEELYLLEQQPTPEQFQKAIRKSTIDCTFVPVFMGSAFKNKGVLVMSFSLLILCRFKLFWMVSAPTCLLQMTKSTRLLIWITMKRKYRALSVLGSSRLHLVENRMMIWSLWLSNWKNLVLVS